MELRMLDIKCVLRFLIMKYVTPNVTQVTPISMSAPVQVRLLCTDAVKIGFSGDPGAGTDDIHPLPFAPSFDDPDKNKDIGLVEELICQ
jgi:hypothetical protein